MRNPPLDGVWRIVDRKIPQNLHPLIDGMDCYVFRRAGGKWITDEWTIFYLSVEKFWGKG